MTTLFYKITSDKLEKDNHSYMTEYMNTQSLISLKSYVHETLMNESALNSIKEIKTDEYIEYIFVDQIEREISIKFIEPITVENVTDFQTIRTEFLNDLHSNYQKSIESKKVNLKSLKRKILAYTLISSLFVGGYTYASNTPPIKEKIAVHTLENELTVHSLNEANCNVHDDNTSCKLPSVSNDDLAYDPVAIMHKRIEIYCNINGLSVEVAEEACSILDNQLNYGINEDNDLYKFYKNTR